MSQATTKEETTPKTARQVIPMIFNWSEKTPFEAAAELTLEEVEKTGAALKEAKETDTVIGTIPEFAQRIFTLRQQYLQKGIEVADDVTGFDQLFTAMKTMHTQKHQLEDLQKKANMLNVIGFAIATDALGCVCGESPNAIRRGWVLIEEGNEEDEGLGGLQEFLNFMMGGGR